ncbi:hypothetical protein K438DRAFT_1851398 [Mycena galopus ATCC 62051]|nr:hypothetical protein K438DRAFT_1851398 [Mycena galopus ATCC 62051]
MSKTFTNPSSHHLHTSQDLYNVFLTLRLLRGPKYGLKYRDFGWDGGICQSRTSDGQGIKNFEAPLFWRKKHFLGATSLLCVCSLPLATGTLSDRWAAPHGLWTAPCCALMVWAMP